MTSERQGKLIRVVEAEVCCDPEWEAAYQRFETPEEEIRKFLGRERQLGADLWPRDARIVEIFCGRGNGMVALQRQGFTNVEGVDLSGSLLETYQGPFTGYVADCRQLPFESAAKDIVIVQGGLHHLPSLPDDLERVLAEVERVLVPGGRFVIVEPWLTPFLSCVHWGLRRRLLRRLWGKLDASATMVEREIVTYKQWLGMPTAILALLEQFFEPRLKRIAWGQLRFVGLKR